MAAVWFQRRYPVRIEAFRIRRGSGGAGQWHGGDGIIRRYHFLEPLTVSLLTEHRREGPCGLMGGLPGAPAGPCRYRLSP